jgi:hypothetical protein
VVGVYSPSWWRYHDHVSLRVLRRDGGHIERMWGDSTSPSQDGIERKFIKHSESYNNARSKTINARSAAWSSLTARVPICRAPGSSDAPNPCRRQELLATFSKRHPGRVPAARCANPQLSYGYLLIMVNMDMTMWVPLSTLIDRRSGFPGQDGDF